MSFNTIRENKILAKISEFTVSLDQDFPDIDLTCPSQLPVFEKKTQMLIERSILYHCTIHKEGRVEYRNI